MPRSLNRHPWHPRGVGGVKALVAIEGRSWAEMGKARKPMIQNMLARIRPEMTADKQESE